jgi:hypothetical protein
MRKMLISSAAVILCAAAVPAIAAPATANQDNNQTGAQTSRPQQRAGDPNRRVCVADRLSDSRIRRRICRTQAEWDSLQQNDDPSLIR